MNTNLQENESDVFTHGKSMHKQNTKSTNKRNMKLKNSYE